MRYRVIDTHRNLTEKTAQQIYDIFREVKGTDKKDAVNQVDFCEWYKKEYALPCFEVVATEGDEMVGYLRALRSSESAAAWLIGDVQVKEKYRCKGVASRMYELAIAEIEDYRPSEIIVASVKVDNKNSIFLHEKMGFVNTGKKCDFPHLFFDDDEIEYRRNVYQEYEVINEKATINKLLPLWIEFEKSAGAFVDESASRKNLASKIAKCANNDFYEFYTIWCGNSLVGFGYDDGDSEVAFKI